ncbi:MAG TPA: sodium-dependent transporter [bacterium]|nr:sodium-dependent transporter [bacterium]
MERGFWSSGKGFVIAAAGSAIGLGNIWRFPYMAGMNGGAVFLLIYLFTVVLIGYPLFINEMIIGRKTHLNPVGAMRAIAPGSPWWLAGALGVFTGFIILSYYSVVAGWSLAYIFKSVTGGFREGINSLDIFRDHISNPLSVISWHAVFMFLCIVIIAYGVEKGIERSVRVLMPLLGLLLVFLIIRSMTLPGSIEGLMFFLKPDFSEITGKTFLAAIAQSFFTLSLGMGAIITYGSYLSKKDEIPVNALSVVGLDTLVAVMAGFAIFPAVFALGFEPASGPGLTFITLPAVFSKMPAGEFFGFAFFVLLSIAALTSGISLLEVIVAWAVDEKSFSRKKASVIFGTVIFLIGILPALGYSILQDVKFRNMDILDNFDWFANSIFMPLGALLTAIFTGYAWRSKNACMEANLVKSRIKVGTWWVFLIKYIVPVAIVAIMVVGLLSKS